MSPCAIGLKAYMTSLASACKDSTSLYASGLKAYMTVTADAAKIPRAHVLVGLRLI